MISRTLRHFAAVCGGRFDGPDATFTDVNHDTRTLSAGQLYFALRGERFDGNDFLPAAAAAGAVAAVTTAPSIRRHCR